MKFAQILLALILLSSFVFMTTDVQAITTLGKGVTLGDWLSPDEDYYIQTTRYTKTDFENIKALGCDFVRITVNFNTSGMSPDGVISPIQKKCLDDAVMWAQEAGLKVIIANVGGAISDATAVATAERVAGNWKDIAGHFASTGDDVVVYEIFASPGNLISAEAWNTAANTIIAALRQADAKHTMIVGPVNWYSSDQLANLEKFADTNVLYAFEMNDPVLFTRQGHTYREVVYNTVEVPFPYSAGKMPAMAAGDPASEAAAQAAYDNYATEGTVDWVKGHVDAVAQAAADKGMPLWCSSIGVNTGAQWYNGALGYDVPPADRAAWYEAARTEMETKGIGWTLTNYIGNYGVFDNYDGGTANWMMFSNYPYDVNATVATSLGLIAPTPSLYVPTPLTEGIVIFDEEINPIARLGFWLGDGEPNFFVTDYPVSGKYCMAILYPGQYNAVDFFFPLYQDMEAMMEDGYVLDFFIRCDDPTGHIQARFEKTNEFEEDRPWRMNYDIRDGVSTDAGPVSFDGDWQRVTIPLASMDNQGAWDPDDQMWYNGPGDVNWGTVQRFQFVSETAPQPDTEIYIDRVRIVDPVTLVKEKGGTVPGEFALSANYPNPFNPSTTIQYTLATNGNVKLAVYNVRGELVKTLASGVQPAGDYSVQWNGTNQQGIAVTSGLYFYRLTSDKQELTRSMLLVR
jgi:endoglucanase